MNHSELTDKIDREIMKLDSIANLIANESETMDGIALTIKDCAETIRKLLEEHTKPKQLHHLDPAIKPLKNP